MDEFPQPNPPVGSIINAPLKSTGCARVTITHSGMTAEVNGAELKQSAEGHWVIAQSRGGAAVNTSLRVPAVIGITAAGDAVALFRWYDKWLGAYHRKLQFSREWEMLDGSCLPPELAAIADDALNNQP